MAPGTQSRDLSALPFSDALVTHPILFLRLCESHDFGHTKQTCVVEAALYPPPVLRHPFFPA
jgi:hypothetical protein